MLTRVIHCMVYMHMYLQIFVSQYKISFVGWKIQHFPVTAEPINTNTLNNLQDTVGSYEYRYIQVTQSYFAENIE